MGNRNIVARKINNAPPLMFSDVGDSGSNTPNSVPQAINNKSEPNNEQMIIIVIGHSLPLIIMVVLSSPNVFNKWQPKSAWNAAFGCPSE